MQIEPQPTASVPAAEVTQKLQSLGWIAPNEADDMRARVAKLERALAGACIRFEEWRDAMQSARQCIDADDVIGAHEILVKALGEKE